MAKKKETNGVSEEEQVVDEFDNLEASADLQDDSVEEWMPEDTGLSEGLVAEALDDSDPFDDGFNFEDAVGDDTSGVGDDFSMNDTLDDEEEAFSFDEFADDKGDPKAELMAKIQEVQDYLNENKPAAIGGIVAMLLLLLWLFGGLSSHEDKAAAQAVQQASMTESDSQREEALEHELKTFEDQFSEYSSQEDHKINDLGAKVNLLFDNAKKTKQELIKQSKQLSEIKDSLQRLTVDRARHTEHTQLLKQRSGLYTISVIVPGRVWLRTANGHEFTASVGDKIEGYGTVVKIEPDYGRVLTSSGKAIYLGRDDS